MKKTLLITAIIGVIINVFLNVVTSNDMAGDFLIFYAAFPVLYIAVGFGLKFKDVSEWPWIATVVNSPCMVILIVGLFIYKINEEIGYQVWCRGCFVALLCSILILEYYLYDLFFDK